MRLVGDLVISGLGQVKGLRVDNLATDPSSPSLGQIWYNSAEGHYKGWDGTTVTTFASGGSTGAVQSELDTAEAAAGLNTDGTFTAPVGSNYLGSATTLKGADVLLDTQIKTVADGLATANTAAGNLLTEVNAVENSVGLNSDGTWTAPIGTNYLGSASSLKNADTLLDTQLKTATDDAAAANSNANGRVSKSGDTMTGDLILSGGTTQIVIPNVPTLATHGVNKGYVDGQLAGLEWIKAILAPNVIDQTATPPAAPLVGDAYIVAGTPTGAWSAIAPGTLVEWNGTVWVEVQLLIEGSRVGISMETATVAEGVFLAKDNNIATVVGIAGAFTFTFEAPVDRWTVSVLDPQGMHFGHSYTYNLDVTSWIEFQGPSATGAGVGLVWAGNILNVNLGASITQLPTDEIGVDILSSGGLFNTVDGSTPSTDAAAQLSVKLNGATLNLSASGLMIATSGVTATEIAASVAGDGLTGGAGSALAVGAGTGLSVSADAIAFDTTWGDTRYLTLSGGTLTGALILAADPTVALGSATKQYVDALATRVDAGTFVYNGSVAATTHVVPHALGNQYNGVTVYDSTDKVIIPDSITADSSSQLTVTFASAITCRVVVNGVKAA